MDIINKFNFSNFVIVVYKKPKLYFFEKYLKISKFKKLLTKKKEVRKYRSGKEMQISLKNVVYVFLLSLILIDLQFLFWWYKILVDESIRV